MAKQPKSRKAAQAAVPPARTRAVRTTALRVGGAAAVLGLGFALYLLNLRHDSVAHRETHTAVAIVAPPKPASPPAPVARAAAADDDAPAHPPPRRDLDAASPKAMPAALRAAFDTWLMGAYAKCWRAPKATPDGDPYLPKVRVAFREDGELAGPPKLVNPPSDPAWKPHAEAALKAVKGCDPLHVPDKYAEYYPAWKSRTVYFDPTRN
jgi:hypothetical protein